MGEEERDCLASLSSVIGMAVDLRSNGTHAVIDNTGAHLLGTGVVPPGLVQAQKLESIGTLAGGIAHDFNNIVGAVLGYATHIKALVTKDNPIYRHASIIEQQSLRGCDLTKQLLAFARGGERRRQPLDVNAIVAETATLLSRTVGPDIAVDVQASPDLPAIEADPVQLQQILLNLAVNAKDAMPQGGRLTIETRVAHLDQRFVASAPGLRPGDYVEVIVGDTGLGMTPDIMERMFEPFFTTKSNGQGSGLGLAVVYGVVKGHAGHVTVDSSPGIGTTVRLYFPSSGRSAVPVEIRGDEALSDVIADDKPPPVIPLVPEWEDGRDRRRGRDPEPSGSAESKSDSDEAADGRVDVGRVPVAPARPGRKSGRPARAAHAPVTIPVSEAGDAGSEAAEGLDPDRHPGSKEDDGRVRILVVDDEEALRELARDILESRGYEVLLAKDGVEALTIYRKHWGRIAMVLLDMMMPRLGGLETFRRMRGMDRQLHVLLCSGYSHNEQAQLAIREGAVGLLPKPYTMTELLAWVDKVKKRGAEPSKKSPRPGPPRTQS